MYSNNIQDELEPRPVPKPTQFQEITARPEVPELSVVFESSESNPKPSTRTGSYTANQTTQETYSEWKQRQNRSPIFKEVHHYEPQNKNYYGSSSYSDCDQNLYGRFSDRTSYKSGSECHKCSCQNTPTVKDIYSMMQVQNEQIKFILETIQKLLLTVLSNQQNQHKCCYSENIHHKKSDDCTTVKILKKNDVQEEFPSQISVDNEVEGSRIGKKKEIVQKKKKLDKCLTKPVITSATKDKPKTLNVSKCHNTNEKKRENKKERTYSIASDESFDLNANDVQVIEAPISPEQSIHIEMKSSSEDSSNSDCEENKDKQIEVGWTMYKNIIGQVNNLLEDNKNELKSEEAKSAESIKPSTAKSKNFEPYKQFISPENNKIDSSLQMQALAMQYLSPEHAVKLVDMNKHFVPTTQSAMKSPNNYSISTLHYMERYHLIGPEQNCTSGNPQQKLSTEVSVKKKKKSTHKNKTPTKILNITELKQQPKLL